MKSDNFNCYLIAFNWFSFTTFKMHNFLLALLNISTVWIHVQQQQKIDLKVLINADNETVIEQL